MTERRKSVEIQSGVHKTLKEMKRDVKRKLVFLNDNRLGKELEKKEFNIYYEAPRVLQRKKGRKV